MYSVVKVFVCKINICCFSVVVDGFGYCIYVVLSFRCFVSNVGCGCEIIVDEYCFGWEGMWIILFYVFNGYCI